MADVTMTDKELVEAVSTDDFRSVTNILYDENEVVDSFNFKWPDGSDGVFSATSKDPNTGAISAYNAAYLGDPPRTVFQPSITRSAATGVVIDQPAFTVSYS